MRNNLWSICFFSLFTTISFAQETPVSSQYSFTLDEAIEFALENSYQSINARRDVAKALKQKWETTATGLPQINAAIDYQNQLKQPVSLLPASAFDSRESTINTVEEFFDLTANGSPDPLEGFIPVVFGTKQQLTASATLSQLLFDGSYLVGLEAAKSFLQYTNDSQEKTQLNVRESVINAYGSVLVSNESVKILENNKTALEKNYEERKKIFENGLAEEEDVEQLQITLLQITNQLNNAQRLSKIALQMFNLTIGVDVDSNTVLSDNLNTLTIKNVDTSVGLKPFVIENNVDYRLGYLLTEQRRLELKLEKSKALPTLSAFVNYGTQANSNSFTFLENEQRWFQSSILGVSLNIPIFSSLGRSARTQQARIAFEQANTSFTEVQQQIQLQYNSTVSDYQLSLETYETSKQNLALAERIENKNQIKYTEGLASSFELRQAQLQLYSVQQEVLQAMLTIINNKAKLESIQNTPNN
ncbi:TolC family protein [Aquimarina sp. AD1]|uniref:TolC family protein n=1 Tax=Aquimarina sp. (strain AD1) TaxID=1714848 RepID=UPI000E4772B4|nr:TolC family protein [Aquimarina sp. AD1]AXT57703.1 TolC family protein [Aquimarina sp. AD1]RKN37044.1 TolC family protein [Aquimarina sp. AD1]